MDDKEKIELLKKDNADLESRIILQEVAENTRRVDKLEDDVKYIKSEISELKKAQDKTYIVITTFISQHKYDLLKWGVFGILSLVIAFSGIYIAQRRSLESVRDDILKVLIRERINYGTKQEQEKGG